MALLSLTQTEQGVSGFLLVVQRDGRGGTKSDTITVEGAADGNALILQTKTFMNLGSVTISGRLAGAVLTLSLPSSSGKVESTRFARGTQEKFNAALLAWQQQLKTAYLKRQRVEEIAAARAARARAAITAANELQDSASALLLATKRLQQSAVFAQDISGCETQLKAIEESADRLEREAANSDCLRRHDQLVYLHDQVVYLRDMRGYLEDRATNIEGQITDVAQRQADIERQMRVFEQALADDSTKSVTGADARTLTQACLQLVDAVTDELKRARTTVIDAKRSSDTIVRKGADRYAQVARRVNAGPCRER